jgi:exo-1,4-beta-D-glucosaminidase
MLTRVLRDPRYPPDNGTGIWRHVSLQQSGPVAISSPRITHDFQYTWQRTVTAAVRADIHNNVNTTVDVDVQAVIQAGDGSQYNAAQMITLAAGEDKTAALLITIDDPEIWWPAQWGNQPLYVLNITASVNGSVTDLTEPRKFGIRHVSSYVNGYNDTAFLVNGQPFLVLGAGYSADIFYRFDTQRARRQLQLVLDMGLNTIRLEGKQEHPELYELADEMGVMIMAGWECCDKWEGWTYNDEADGVIWDDADYRFANASMLHEAASMQTHPSFLAFLVGSDFWPDDRATQIYVDALDYYNWPNPVVASAAKRGYPELLGPSGMKMDGPYDCESPFRLPSGALTGFFQGSLPSTGGVTSSELHLASGVSLALVLERPKSAVWKSSCLRMT